MSSTQFPRACATASYPRWRSRNHAVVTRELTTPVHRNVAVLDHPAIPALAPDAPGQGTGPRSRST